MPAHIERNTSLVVVLSNDSNEIEQQLAPSPDAAVAAAIRMLARRGDDLTAGMVLYRARA
jgi:hypothetical protein